MTITCETKQVFDRVPPVRWEHVPCNLCGSGDAEHYHRERLSYFNRVLDFQIVRCQQCGLVYTNPRLSDYNAAYLWAGSSDPDQFEKHGQAKAMIFAEALDEIERLLNGGPASNSESKCRLLDVGCGSGYFLAAARQRGFEAAGIEPAARPAAYASDYFKVPVLVEDILEADLPGESFDVITAWDVIEHVADPRAVLKRCAEWLKPGGIMALRFPSARWQKIKGVILHKFLASNRPVFSPTIHLYFFNQDTIKQMSRAAGLAIINTRSTPLETNTGNTLIDRIKVVSNYVIRGMETISGSLLCNLEVYCRK